LLRAAVAEHRDADRGDDPPGRNGERARDSVEVAAVGGGSLEGAVVDPHPSLGGSRQPDREACGRERAGRPFDDGDVADRDAVPGPGAVGVPIVVGDCPQA
jgi:hypothetical protein